MVGLRGFREASADSVGRGGCSVSQWQRASSPGVTRSTLVWTIRKIEHAGPRPEQIDQFGLVMNHEIERALAAEFACWQDCVLGMAATGMPTRMLALLCDAV